jgi:hypothetical protein
MADCQASRGSDLLTTTHAYLRHRLRIGISMPKVRPVMWAVLVTPLGLLYGCAKLLGAAVDSVDEAPAAR